MTPRWNRRSFLKTLGLGAAAAALPWWARSRAEAGPMTTPRRVVFFFTGGSMRGLWNPIALPGEPEPTETEFALGPLHQALSPFQSQLLLLQGVDMASAYLDLSQPADPHVNGSTHALAATDRVGPDMPGGPSIDQVIAAKINEVPQTALRSLELVGSGYAGTYNHATAHGPGQLVPQIWDPRVAYDRLFPASEDTRRTKSVLDLVAKDADALGKRLGGEDRQKVEKHRDDLRDLETRLGIGLANKAPRPSASILDPLNGLDFNFEAPPETHAARYSATTDLHIQLIASALAADLTRVVTLTLETPPDPIIGYTAGAFGTPNAHELQHLVANPSWAGSSDPAAIATVSKIHLDQAERFAKLLGALAALKEPDGATLLDNTVVVWCGEIAEGAHDLHDLPWILAGSCGGHFKTGRYLRYPREAGGAGRPHNDLLVAIANAMGVPMTTFGNPDCCNGPLDGLQG